MSKIRTGRRKYYDIFSRVYDAFIKLHARRDEGATRDFLVEVPELKDIPTPLILDICCGTGAVIVAFAKRYEKSISIGYDFSHGMLRKAEEKLGAQRVRFIEGDAAALPFADDNFDVITCSHALYELKGEARQTALLEMRRVVKPEGMVLIMEHEVPHHPLVRLLFNLRMMAMGSADAREFVKGGLKIYERIFPSVSLTHSPSGKSRLITCQK